MKIEERQKAIDENNAQRVKLDQEISEKHHALGVLNEQHRVLERALHDEVQAQAKAQHEAEHAAKGEDVKAEGDGGTAAAN